MIFMKKPGDNYRLTFYFHLMILNTLPILPGPEKAQGEFL